MLDLSGLEYVSSAGLRCFMLASRQAKAQHGRIVVAALQPMVAEIFEISHFNLVFQVFPTVREALAAASTEAAAGRVRPGDSAGMRIRFWGTRGSIPVALTSADIRDKLARALVRGLGPQLRLATRRRTPTPRTRARLLAHPHLRRPHALRGAGPRRRRVLRLRHGQRRAPLRRARARAPGAAARPRSTCSCRTCTGTTSWASRSSGRPTSRARRSASTAATTSASTPSACSRPPPCFPVDFSQLAADHRVREARARPAQRGLRPRRDAAPAAALGRLLRLPLREATARASSTRPTPSTSSRTAPRPRASRRSSATPTW